VPTFKTFEELATLVISGSTWVSRFRYVFKTGLQGELPVWSTIKAESIGAHSKTIVAPLVNSRDFAPGLIKMFKCALAPPRGLISVTLKSFGILNFW
jgi:hypothetical protein